MEAPKAAARCPVNTGRRLERGVGDAMDDQQPPVKKGCPVIHTSGHKPQGPSKEGGKASVPEAKVGCPVFDVGDMQGPGSVGNDLNVQLNLSDLISQGAYPFNISSPDSTESGGSKLGLSTVSSDAMYDMFSKAPVTGGVPLSQNSTIIVPQPKQVAPGVQGGVYVCPLTGAGIFPPPHEKRTDDGNEHAGCFTPLLCRKKGTFAEEVKAFEMAKGRHIRLMEGIERVNKVSIADKNTQALFNTLLTILLETTESAYGFISSVHLRPNGAIYMKIQAITNISWTPALRHFFENNAPKGLIFSNPRTLFGQVWETQRPVISNDIERDPRAGGLPPGHPKINSFLGMPLIAGGEFIGVFGISNHEGGYDKAMALDVQPLTSAVAQIIYAFEQKRRRMDAELHLSSIIQAADEGIITINKGGVVTSMNLAACAMFGYSSSVDKQSHGLPVPPANLLLEEIISSMDGLPSKEFMAEGLEPLVGFLWTAQGTRADGSSIPVEVSITKASSGAFGEDGFFVAVLRDIGDRLVTEAKLQASEERWLYALSGSDDGVWDWGLQENEMFLSERWKQMLGYENDEIGTKFEDWVALLHPDDKEKAFLALNEHLSGQSAQFVNEQRLRHKDNSYRWFLHRGKVISRSEDGSPLRVVGTHCDITQRKKDEEAIVAAKDDAERASRAKADFLATMSHEIRTPMNGVIGMTSILLETELTAEQRDHVTTIRDSGDVLLQIIKDILDYSKIESGKLEMECTAFNFMQAVERVAELLIVNAESKGLELAIQAEGNAPCCIVGDAGRTLQILLNLVSNAIKFTDKGHILIKIGHEIQPRGDASRKEGSKPEFEKMIVCSIQDSGIGISLDKQDRLFQHFSQVDASTTRRFGGTGLGLAISKQLTELMGGVISFGSLGLGHGTTFTLKLPASELDAGGQDVAEDYEFPAPLAVPDALRNASILLVGPTKVTQTALSTQLSTWGVKHECVAGRPEVVMPLLIESAPMSAGPSPANSTRASSTDFHIDASSCPELDEPAQVEGLVLDLPSSRWQHRRERRDAFDDEATPPLTPRFSMEGHVTCSKEKDAYDVVLLDCSKTGRVDDGQMADVLRQVQQRSWGIILLLGRLQVGEKEERRLIRLFGPQKPVILRKPVVRPKPLLAALEGALFARHSDRTVARPEQNNSRLREARPKVTAAEGTPTINGRVLLVEDNYVNQKVAKSILQTLGMTVDIANNGLEAVTAAQRVNYDIIFMDCQMPEMDGFSASRRIRELERDRLVGDGAYVVPIVALTANALKGDRERCLEAGMSDYITKPISKKALLKAIEAHFVPRNLVREPSEITFVVDSAAVPSKLI